MHLPYIEAPMPLNSQDNKMPSARNRLPLLELLASEDPQTPHPQHYRLLLILLVTLQHLH